MDANGDINPATAAQLLGVNSHTVRRWCKDHAPYLSAGANPLPGMARALTGRDMEVLRTVQTLRNQGLLTPAINDRLASLTFAEAVKDDANPVTDQQDAVIGHPDAQERLQQAPGAVVALDAMNALQARLATLEGLETRIREDRRNALYYVGIGIVIGLLLALMFFAGGAWMLGK